MTDYNTIIYEVSENGVCRLTMNRPDQRNAINREMAEDMLDAFLKAKKDPAVKVILFSGEGKLLGFVGKTGVVID